MPSFEAALVAGEISSGHIDAVVRVLARLSGPVRDEFVEHEASLLVAARRERMAMFESTVRDLARQLVARYRSRSEADALEQQRTASRIRRWRDQLTGMCHTHVELDPVRDADLKSALDAHLRRLRKDANAGVPWNELEVDAFVRAVTAGVTRPTTTATGTATAGPAAADNHTGTGGAVEAVDDVPAHLRVPQVVVLADLDTLRDGLHHHGICETAAGIPLPVDTVRQMCCDAEIVPVVLDGAGRALDVGRSSRTVTAAQRQALRAMHRTCIRPDCTVPFDACRIHHVEWYERDLGPTDLANLAPLCDRDHHLVHEGRWTLKLDAAWVATWIRPDGTIHWTGTCVDRAPGGVRPDHATEALRPAG